MDALSISATCLVILSILIIIFFPKLRYKLSLRDGLRSYSNDRYQLFVFAHSRFFKVLEGKQVYERYSEYMKALYNKDNFDKVKSEHQNNQRRINLSFLSEVLEDEQFVRRYFSGDSLPYDKFLEMETEWETRPVKKDSANTPDMPRSNYKGKLTEEERKSPGSFSLLTVDRNKEQALYEWVDRKMKTLSNSEEYAALVLSLKESALIEFASIVELYDCINASFPSKFKIQYNALTNAIKLFTDRSCSEDAEEKISELIEKYKTELDGI